jgi:glycosyltransferase involved in cell wall biosynthesis
MRIGINALGLSPGQVGGVEVYLRNLVVNLGQVDPEDEYLVFISQRNQMAFGSILPPNVRRVLIPPSPPSSPLLRGLRYWGLLHSSLAEQLEGSGVDIIHYPDSIINPPGIALPCVLTSHDIQHEYFPHHFPLKMRLLRKLTYAPSARKARRVITDSQFARETLVQKFRLPAEKVIPIHWGVDAAFRPDLSLAEVERVRHKYHLPPVFAFYPASTWPHKNHPRLVQAMSLLQRKYHSECKLVLCGQPQWGHGALLAALEGYCPQKDVLFLDYVPAEDLPALYRAAWLLVYPSLFEGFGIPLVEAMSCGCPIVCSNVTSLPEVVGDAALLVNPYDVEELADAIQRVLHDEDLRAGLVAKGLARARHFSWERAARQTAQVYRQACSAKSEKTVTE